MEWKYQIILTYRIVPIPTTLSDLKYSLTTAIINFLKSTILENITRVS